MQKNQKALSAYKKQKRILELYKKEETLRQKEVKKNEEQLKTHSRNVTNQNDEKYFRDLSLAVLSNAIIKILFG